MGYKDMSYQDMAIRTKAVAELKFAEQDYVGAKEFARKAKNISPGLNIISIFITVIDIYLSREKIVDGQPDWYGILGLEKPATPMKIFESFDKINNDIKLWEDMVIGVEGASEILFEAYAVLTGISWVECPRCLRKFNCSKERINKEIVCISCGVVFHAVSRPEFKIPETSSGSNDDA